MPKVNIKTVLLWIFFICFDFFIAAGFSELWIRFFIPVDNTCYYHDPILGDRFCPNQSTYGYVEKGYSNIFISNSKGFHDIERTKQKKENTLRIHIYGDSITTAEGVPIPYTIPSLIENYINEQDPVVSVEILNMAPAEDSTVSQYMTFKHIGKSYSPDVVICYFMSDFQDNIIETHKRTKSPYFDLNNNNELIFIPPIPVDTTTPIERLKKISMLLRLLANKFLASKLYANYGDLKDNFSFSDLGWQETAVTTQEKNNISINNTKRIEQLLAEKSYPLTLRLFQEFNLEAHNIGAVFMIIDGIRFRPNISKTYTNKNLKQFCDNNGIIYIPVYEEYETLRKSDVTGKFFFKDGHPTKLGNEVLSKIIAEKLHSHL